MLREVRDNLANLPPDATRAWLALRAIVIVENDKLEHKLRARSLRVTLSATSRPCLIGPQHRRTQGLTSGKDFA